MKLRLNINRGSMEDTIVLQNILNNYNVGVDVIPSISYRNGLGAEFIPALLMLLPETTQFINAILPAIKACIEVGKPSGTKYVIELANGEKKIHIMNEDGKEIDIGKTVKICNEIHFFEWHIRDKYRIRRMVWENLTYEKAYNQAIHSL